MQNGKSLLIQAVRALREEIYGSIRAQLLDEHGVYRTYQEIADAVGVSVATVQRVAGLNNISRPVGPRPKISTTEEHGHGE